MSNKPKELESLHILTDEEQAQVLQELTDNAELHTGFAHAFRSAMQGLTIEERLQVYEAIVSQEPSNEASRLLERIILEAYDLDPKALMEFIEQPTKPR